jgi:ribonuclease E
MDESMTNSGLDPSQTTLPDPRPMSGGDAPHSQPPPEVDPRLRRPVEAVDQATGAEPADEDGASAAALSAAARKRRRGSRGGQRRRKPASGVAKPGVAADADVEETDGADTEETDDAEGTDPGETDANEGVGDAPVGMVSVGGAARLAGVGSLAADDGRSPVMDDNPDLPDPPREAKVLDAAAADRALVRRRPQVGDTITMPHHLPPPPGKSTPKAQRPAPKTGPQAATTTAQPDEIRPAGSAPDGSRKPRKTRPGRSKKPAQSPRAAEMEATLVERRRGRERNGRPIGRYMMAVQVRDDLTQVAVLEGRSLIEHYVSRPADDVSQIHGNIYLGRVQNILPGMEAAFVDIATPKNAVLYRGDVQYDSEDLLEPASGSRKKSELRIEQMLKSKQLIVCQVTKNPIGAKGARLTQDVSLPGRFVVLIPNSSTFGISKRLPDDERKRLRSILDRVRPDEHGLIVRTAAESASEEELRADVLRLSVTWNEIAAKAEQARKSGRPALLYREPPLAVRVIREEFNAEYRTVVIDDRRLYDEIKGYVTALNPELADRVELYDAAAEGLPLYERNHVHEQVHKALDRKVWLPSGGSLIIEHTEALTVIDVNTGKNVGSTNLEETVFHNNLEAADEIARQLRLRDIGGIIVIDFIDMEIRENRRKVVDSFRSALSRDKTRTQVFDISELGLVEMTRKRIGEGLLTSFADQCPSCEGRGVMIDLKMLE